MKVLRFFLLLSVALLLAGCVLSSEAFYTQEVKVEPPPLGGRWQLIGKDGSPQENEFWEFEGNQVTAFDERGQWRSLTVTYFKVDGVLFADTIAGEPGDDITASEAYRSLHLVPFHMVSRVELGGDRFILRPLLTKEFKTATAGMPFATWMVQTDYESFVYNASSGDWVTFLKQHARDDGLFSEESKLVFVRQID